MSRRGPKGGHLALVRAADQVEADELDGKCGGRTKKGGKCKRRAGQGTDHPGVGECISHEGQVDAGAPCPLPLTPLEARLWEDVVGQLERSGLRRAAYWASIYGLVSALAGLHVAKLELRTAAKGTVSDAKGSIKKHPATTTCNQMLAHVRAYSAELGLTPAALAKVGTPAGSAPSAMDNLIDGG